MKIYKNFVYRSLANILLDLLKRVLLFIFFVGSPVFASSATALIDEVIAESQSPRLYDWHSEKLGLEYSSFNLSEKNNFESSGYSFALRSAISPRFFGFLGLRFIETIPTVSSEMLALTPYQQAAQPSRKELFLQGAIPLLAGRSFTLLSPWVSDWEHVLYLKLGAHYNFFGEGFSFANKSFVELPAQRSIAYKWVGELGVRLQFSLPRSLSLFMDLDHFFPLKNTDADLKQWSLVGGGIAWAFF